MSNLTLIYGGTFDPPHRAHIQLPHAAASALNAHLLYIPAGQPPHKPASMTAPEHRLAMLRLALADSPIATIDDLELHRTGPSYTVDTLRQLKQRHPDTTYRLLIGADMAAIFYKWREPRAIMELAEPLVMMRSPYNVDGLLATLPADLAPDEKQAWRSRIVAVPTVDISSTELRTLLQAGDYRNPRLREMLAPGVIDYIAAHHLYAPPSWKSL